MSVSATEGVSPTSPTSSPTAFAAATGGAPSADKDMFLQLLVAQLRYQDPMNPTDSTQFLSQSAQFTALEKMEAVAAQTATLVQTSLAFGASGLVGREVSFTAADGSTATGTVSGVTFGAAGPVLDVGGREVPLGNVLSVTGGAGGAGARTAPGSAPEAGTQPDAAATTPTTT